jgi:hypothetical protein
MATNIFDLELTTKALKAGISTISVEDLNRQIEDRIAFLTNAVNEFLSGVAQDVPSEEKMIDVSTPATAMKKVGEFGQARTEADRSVVSLQFPLFKFSKATGWSEEFIRRASVEDFRKGVLDAEYAYRTSLQDELKTACFNNIQRQHNDKFDTQRDLTVRPFYNGDGQAIPTSPSGETFTAATHTHYSGTSGSSLSVYDIDTLLIDNIVEHGGMKGITLFVAPNGKAALEAVTSTKFLAATRPNIIYSDTADRSVFQDNLDSDPDNKLIGAWDGYPVFTRSWIPTNYILALATGAAEKAIGYRQDKSLKGLVPLPLISNNIITAAEWRAYFGMGANNRGAGAVLDTAHQTNYSAPSGLVL